MKAPSIKEFADQLVELMPVLMKELWQYERNYVTSGKITLPQLSMLYHLLREGACTMRNLAVAARTRESTATGLADRLVALRLVRRTRNAKDRRVVYVDLTPKGRRVMHQFHAQRRRSIMRMYGRLSGDDRARYIEIMQSLVSGLAGYRSKDRGDA